MIQRKVIAQNITNLTDARYFAAWGVEYVSFNFLQDSNSRISYEAAKEIKEWLEGPDCLIESGSLEFDEFGDGYILDSMYSTMPLTKTAFFRIPFSEWEKGLAGGNYIVKIKASDLTELRKLKQEDGIVIYLDVSDLKLDDIKSIPNYWSLAVQGGEEEKVGVKHFDALDELYDFLIDEE